MSELPNNPLVKQSDLPYAAPLFAQVKPEHFEPAVDWAIEQAKERLDSIRNNPDAPTFENTVAAFEFASEELSRIGSVISVFTSTKNTKEVQAANDAIIPKISEFYAGLLLDKKIFDRVNVVYQQKDSLSLNEEELVLLTHTYDAFISNGVALEGEAKEHYKKLRIELSDVNKTLGNNMVNHAQQLSVILTAEEKGRLAGVPQDVIEMYSEMAKRDDNAPDDGYKIPMNPPPIDVFEFADDRSLREQVFYVLQKKCAEGEFDNHKPFRRNMELKYEMAKMLNFMHYADYVLKTSHRMTDDFNVVQDFVEQNAKHYSVAANSFFNKVLEYAREKDGIEILMPWDRLFYINKYKEETIGFDPQSVRPYFELNNVLAGVFAHAEKLYGISIVAADKGKYETVNEDVTVYEVFDKDTQKIRSLFYANFLSNDDKRGGAWMNEIRGSGDYKGVRCIPIITNEMNLKRPSKGNPTLLNADEVETVFHEFGHACHGMLSNGRFPSLAGTNTSRDYVEMPSQINECWAFKTEVLATYAKHYETGEVIPTDLVEKLQALKKFDIQWQGIRQTEFGLIDMAFHTANPVELPSTKEVENKIMDKYRPDAIAKLKDAPPFSINFGHIFSGYASGYYVYKWADALVADIREAFEQAEKNGEGCYPEKLCQAFKKCMIEPGGTKPAAEMLADFKSRAGCYSSIDMDVTAMYKAEGIA